MKNIFITLVAICIYTNIQASEVESYKLTGNISLAANENNLFLNFGGPNIKYEKNNFSVSTSFFPSLRSDSKTNTVSPILGAGLILSFEKFSLVLPSYYYGNNWYGAVGLGYRF